MLTFEERHIARWFATSLHVRSTHRGPARSHARAFASFVFPLKWKMISICCCIPIVTFKLPCPAGLNAMAKRWIDLSRCMAWSELQHSIHAAGARTSFADDADDEQQIEIADETDALGCHLYLMQPAAAATLMHDANWTRCYRTVYKNNCLNWNWEVVMTCLSLDLISFNLPRLLWQVTESD